MLEPSSEHPARPSTGASGRDSQLMCLERYLFISNIETFLLPNSGCSVELARISRRFSGFCSLFLRMYAQTLLTTSERGSGELPTTMASCSDGCIGRMKAAFGLRFVFAFAFAGAFLAFTVFLTVFAFAFAFAGFAGFRALAGFPFFADFLVAFAM